MEREKIYVGFRFDPKLRQRLIAAAAENYRSFNREVEYRLEQTLAAEGKQAKDQVAA